MSPLWAVVCRPGPGCMEPGTPFCASIQSLATYLRYTHAISYARLSALFTQVYGVSISEGAWPTSSSGCTHSWTTAYEDFDPPAHSRLICRDELVHGSTDAPMEWVFQNTEVWCL